MMKGFREKRAAMLRNTTLDELLLIADFDATLTTGDSDQCHDLCGFSKVLAPEFRQAFAPLLDWEENKTIDTVEWWYRAHNLMVKYGQPQRQLIPRLVRESKMRARPRALAMLKRLATLNVPVLIVSAGLSDVIEVSTCTFACTCIGTGTCTCPPTPFACLSCGMTAARPQYRRPRATLHPGRSSATGVSTAERCAN